MLWVVLAKFGAGGWGQVEIDALYLQSGTQLLRGEFIELFIQNLSRRLLLNLKSSRLGEVEHGGGLLEFVSESDNFFGGTEGVEVAAYGIPDINVVRVATCQCQSVAEICTFIENGSQREQVPDITLRHGYLFSKRYSGLCFLTGLGIELVPT